MRTFKELNDIRRRYACLNTLGLVNLIVGLLIIFDLWWHKFVIALVTIVVLGIVAFSYKRQAKAIEDANLAKEPQRHYSYYKFYSLPQSIALSEVVCFGTFDRGYPKGISVYKALQWGVIVILLFLFYSDLIHSAGYGVAFCHGLLGVILVVGSYSQYTILKSHSAVFLKDQVIYDNKRLYYSEIKKSQAIELKNQNWRIEVNTGKRYYGFEVSRPGFEKLKQMTESAL